MPTAKPAQWTLSIPDRQFESEQHRKTVSARGALAQAGKNEDFADIGMCTGPEPSPLLADGQRPWNSAALTSLLE
jgi:hypothetical protein